MPTANNATATAKRAAIYARAATQPQDAPNAAIDDQIARCADYCHDQGYTVADRYMDAGYSGNSYRRPALQRLIAGAEAGRLGAVIVADLARLARSPRLLASLYRRLDNAGVRIIAVNEGINTATAEGRAQIAVAAIGV